MTPEIPAPHRSVEARLQPRPHVIPCPTMRSRCILALENPQIHHFCMVYRSYSHTFQVYHGLSMFTSQKMEALLHKKKLRSPHPDPPPDQLCFVGLLFNTYTDTCTQFAHRTAGNVWEKWETTRCIGIVWESMGSLGEYLPMTGTSRY